VDLFMIRLENGDSVVLQAETRLKRLNSRVSAQTLANWQKHLQRDQESSTIQLRSI